MRSLLGVIEAFFGYRFAVWESPALSREFKSSNNQ